MSKIKPALEKRHLPVPSEIIDLGKEHPWMLKPLGSRFLREVTGVRKKTQTYNGRGHLNLGLRLVSIVATRTASCPSEAMHWAESPSSGIYSC